MHCLLLFHRLFILLQHLWYFFEALVKSMAYYLIEGGKVKVCLFTCVFSRIFKVFIGNLTLIPRLLLFAVFSSQGTNVFLLPSTMPWRL